MGSRFRLLRGSRFRFRAGCRVAFGFGGSLVAFVCPSGGVGFPVAAPPCFQALRDTKSAFCIIAHVGAITSPAGYKTRILYKTRLFVSWLGCRGVGLPRRRRWSSRRRRFFGWCSACRAWLALGGAGGLFLALAAPAARLPTACALVQLWSFVARAPWFPLLTSPVRAPPSTSAPARPHRGHARHSGYGDCPRRRTASCYAMP